MKRDLERVVPKVEAATLGLLSAGDKTQTVLTRRLTTGGFTDRESRTTALEYLVSVGDVIEIGNIVPLMKRTPKVYSITPQGIETINQLNFFKIKMGE
jgi:hypothetical protein